MSLCACGQTFTPRSGGRPQRWCGADCPALRADNAKRSRRWYKQNRAYVCLRESIRRSKFKHVYRLDHLRKRGVEPFSNADYEALIKSQDGRCALCLTTTPSKRRAYFDVDHCHASGRVRGLLCERCNRAIGLLNEDPAVFRRAIDYLS